MTVLHSCRHPPNPPTLDSTPSVERHGNDQPCNNADQQKCPTTPHHTTTPPSENKTSSQPSSADPTRPHPHLKHTTPRHRGTTTTSTRPKATRRPPILDPTRQGRTAAAARRNTPRRCITATRAAGGIMRTEARRVWRGRMSVGAGRL